MIRLLLALVALVLLATGFSWLADRPGAIALTWQGWHVETSMLAASIAVIAIVAVLILLWSILRAVWRTPGAIAGRFRTRRRSRGFNAVTQGMLAVGSGDVRAAVRQAQEAERILGNEPLALLLRAQAAQLSGDRAAAETAFRAMLAGPETRPLGLRGLFVEARRRGDAGAARRIAAEAVIAQPALPWAATALLEFQSVEGDWDAALGTLARNAGAKLVDKETAARHRAVLLTARAQDEAERDPGKARATAAEVLKLAPGLVPAAVLSSKLHAEAGDIKRAAKVVETAWRINPHPELAHAYTEVRPGDSARDRLARIRSLTASTADDAESAVALARAQAAAREFDAARETLAPLIEAGAPSERVCLLMAEIESEGYGDTGRQREWLARAVRAPRDPVWTADGLVSDVWLPVSPVSGRIDAFEWKAPVERLGGPVHEDFSALEHHAAALPVEATPVIEAKPAAEAAPVIAAPSPVFSPAAAAKVADPARATRPSPIIASRPLPDDPGPDEDGSIHIRRGATILE